MSSNSLSEKLQRNLYLKTYLKELEALKGKAVQISELGDLEQAQALRQAAQKIERPTVVFEIPFSDRKADRFKKFIQVLSTSNPSSIFVFTPRTITCGVLVMPSLSSIKFDFDFRVNEEGILQFTTTDLRDSLLLDFSCTQLDEERMTVEVQGEHWSKIVY